MDTPRRIALLIERVVFGAAAVALLAGAAKLVYLERTQGARLRAQADRQQQRTWSIPAERGEILDCKGRVLAGTERFASVFMDCTWIRDPRFAAYSVAPVLGLDPARLEQQIRDNRERGFVWVKRDISPGEIAALRALRAQRGLRAFVIRYDTRRAYPYGSMASQLLGAVGGENQGLSGVEARYERWLHGVAGRREVVVDAGVRQMGAEIDYEPPVDGATVVLTIDAYLQERAERHLRAAREEFEAQWAIGIVMDPQSGEVLAMATVPNFDILKPVPDGWDRERDGEVAELWRNRCIATMYEPGSTFKPFVAAAALADGYVSLDTVYEFTGKQHWFGGRRIRDTHHAENPDFREIIYNSSNIGMAMLGEQLGIAKLREYVTRFGFGEETGLRVWGEASGMVRPEQDWNGYSVQSIPLGQEVGVTGIQMLVAFSALCNDGILLRPRVVRGLVAADGTTLEDFSARVEVRRVLDEEVVRHFRETALADVVRVGTGERAQLDQWRVFGKTGTPQVADLVHGGYIPEDEPGAHSGTILLGAPVEDPRVAVLVLLYRPMGAKYYGGTVAGPAAREILKDALQYLRVPPSPALPVDESDPGPPRG